MKEAKGMSPVESIIGYRDLNAEFQDCSENSSNEVPTVEVLMIEHVIHTVKTDMVIHTKKTEMMRLVVEIECVGKIVDAFDKATGSSDGLQPEQVDLNYVHALNEPHLHEIRVVLSKHEADQHFSCADPLPI
nr:hypothetical protein [Tanacetum cinerariifolium]